MLPLSYGDFSHMLGYILESIYYSISSRVFICLLFASTILIFNIVVLLNFYFFHTFLSISWAFTFIFATWLVFIQWKVVWEFIGIILNSHNHFGWFDILWYNVSLSKNMVCPSIYSDLFHVFLYMYFIFLAKFIFLIFYNFFNIL